MIKLLVTQNKSGGIIIRSRKNKIITQKIDNPTHILYSNTKRSFLMEEMRVIYLVREKCQLNKILKDKLLIVSAFDSKNNLLATRSVVILNNTAWHNYSGVNIMGRNLYAGFPLVIELIKQCKNRGINTLNLGEINERDGRDLLDLSLA